MPVSQVRIGNSESLAGGFAAVVSGAAVGNGRIRPGQVCERLRHESLIMFRDLGLTPSEMSRVSGLPLSLIERDLMRLDVEVCVRAPVSGEVDGIGAGRGAAGRGRLAAMPGYQSHRITGPANARAVPDGAAGFLKAGHTASAGGDRHD